MIPDYRNDTGAEVVARVAPRVLVALLGVVTASASMWLEPRGPAFYNFIVVGAVLVFVGARGFWLPFVPMQLAAAAWLAVSTFLFRVRGAALGIALVVAALLVLITVATGDARTSKRARTR